MQCAAVRLYVFNVNPISRCAFDVMGPPRPPLFAPYQVCLISTRVVLKLNREPH